MYAVGEDFHSALLRRKRKGELAAELPPPEKHFVTEEEMITELRALQLEEQARNAPLYQTYQDGSNFHPSFAFNALGQFHGFGKMPPLPYTNPDINCTQVNLTVNFPQSTTQQSSSYCLAFKTEPNPAETAECVEMEPIDDRNVTDIKHDGHLPKLHVSKDVLEIKPQPALPPSLILNMAARHNMALVPYVPPIIPIMEKESEKEHQEDLAMVD